MQRCVVQGRFNQMRLDAQFAEQRGAGAPQIVPVPISGVAGCHDLLCFAIPVDQCPATRGAEQ